MESKNKNTKNTNTKATEKEGEKNMNTKTTKTTEKKGEKNMDIRNQSIIENLDQALENLTTEKTALINLMNHVSREKRGIASRKVSDKLADMNHALSIVNNFKALAYYKTTAPIDIVKAGKAVPALALTVKEEDGVFTVEQEEVKVYPTLSGMVKAGIIEASVVDTVDLLRRVVAFLNGDTMALTGDVENKKNVPNKAVASLIENLGTLSATKARSIMRTALKELSGGAIDKNVFPVVYKDFSQFITKRGTEWGTRTTVGKATANDLILEYVHMSLNGKTAFQFVVD